MTFFIILSSKEPGWNQRLGIFRRTASSSNCEVILGGVMTDTDVFSGSGSSDNAAIGASPNIWSDF